VDARLVEQHLGDCMLLAMARIRIVQHPIARNYDLLEIRLDDAPRAVNIRHQFYVHHATLEGNTISRRPINGISFRMFDKGVRVEAR